MNKPDNTEESTGEGLDIGGLGKVAKTIPKEVYIKTTDTLLSEFSRLISPITETTSGVGRYLKEKFDRMIKTEQALGVYSLERAVARAKLRASDESMKLHEPVHPKSFVSTFEEAAKENNQVLHEMWTNLLSSQLAGDNFHPHFLSIMRHFSPAEAAMLTELLPSHKVGLHGGRFISYYDDTTEGWINKDNDIPVRPWTISCVLLRDFGLADVLAPHQNDKRGSVVILYKTKVGQQFLNAVTSSTEAAS